MVGSNAQLHSSGAGLVLGRRYRRGADVPPYPRGINGEPPDGGNRRRRSPYARCKGEVSPLPPSLKGRITRMTEAPKSPAAGFDPHQCRPDPVPSASPLPVVVPGLALLHSSKQKQAEPAFPPDRSSPWTSLRTSPPQIPQRKLNRIKGCDLDAIVVFQRD